jgi:hypothetical protein
MDPRVTLKIETQPVSDGAHSHSIVPGGLLVTS